MFVFSVLLPVLAISLVGYLTLSMRWFESRDADTLTRFTFNLLIPCLLFVSTSRSEFNLRESLSFLAAYYLVVLSMYCLGVLVASRVFHYPPEEQSVYAMGCAYSNTTIVGIPIVAQALGEAALVPLFFIISIQNLVLFAVGTIAAERAHMSTGSILGAIKRLLKQLLGSPITASLLAGLAVNALAIPIWEPLFASVELLAQGAVPASLFVLGMSLGQYHLSRQIVPAVVMTVFNIVLLPLGVWIAMFHVFDVDPVWAGAGVLASAMPVGMSALVFANRYRTGHGVVAAGSLISSVCSVFTLTLILLLLAGHAP
ncbi:MAG: AEC family transporter [Gammaproteobacteria bacterium]|nr:AEC family transporter [Pseudomonadales bacterium]MCP5345307.1 AEC family transporter [Pseudomonadales bacterium]